MKKSVRISIVIFFIVFYMSGCGINDRGVDPGLENDAGRFTGHDHQRGEGYGLWNQQRDPKNPIARIITRDERPGRGINGIVDGRPPDMNRRISRFHAAGEFQGTPRAFTERDTSDRNIPEQIRLELLQLDTVRNVRVISQQNRLLIAVDTETEDRQTLKANITEFINNRYPNKEIIVITDRQAVDRIQLLDDGFRQEQEGALDNDHGPIAGQ
ncbi:hypothetical protein DS745_15950 [Anaerobacillus alkaliphilus]|uniref:Sporulation protein n=1 Tax=Anaerobacillus alkaliphilus TaxID=1548597 RepID=A0A4Q0VNG1_9BACI|nr:YhcN/YlaJ family sporulation lipoprotein [Anaerobacillus alkaliphilus]RXI97853.1 hypothetical protein DS745_15950 [Anaerobacillus alkaliphilus]